MALTVTAAFSQFLKDVVNLDSGETQTARSSRDWLTEQINGIPFSHPKFPKLFPEVHIHYGSFSRRTKIRELDDIDLIVGISALGTTYTDLGAGSIRLTVPDGIALRGYCHDGSNLLNSRKVINLFISYLSDVPQYSKADLKRNGSAAVLSLTSYDWVFDIVPAFFTSPEWDGRTYYIIPDGKGDWMKTDPRIDRDRIGTANRRHDGNILNVIRVVKYWNRRAARPTVPSYFLECLILQFYESNLNTASSYVDVELPAVFAYIAIAIHQSLADPKGIQGDINSLTWEEKQSVSAKASLDAAKAQRGRELESANNMSQSINAWREVFGGDFPIYG